MQAMRCQLLQRNTLPNIQKVPQTDFCDATPYLVFLYLAL